MKLMIVEHFSFTYEEINKCDVVNKLGCKCDESLSPYCQMFVNIYPWDKPIQTYLRDCKHNILLKTSEKLENL